MANWAIVIGIDRYGIQDATLRGAVRDALKMREWLLDPLGGNVPEDNLALVLGPADGAPPLDAALKAAPPDRNSATKAVADLIQRSGGAGERLYFYYSGHGISARTGFSDEDAMLFSDFEWVTPDNSWSLRTLWEYFATYQFADQFLVVDACRNAPRIQEVRIGHWPRPRQRDVGSPPAQQFIVYATSPGLRAAEIADEPGNERAAFTEVLLEGLRGAGRAKTFDSAVQQYVVRWDSLTGHVTKAMEDLKKDVAEGPRPLVQIPQQGGARGVAGRSPNPEMARIPVASLSDEQVNLDVQLQPDDVVSVAEVRLLDDAGAPVETRTQVTGLPVRFTLSPRTYLVHAVAPAHDLAVHRPPVDLYADCEIALALTPTAEAAVPATAPRAAKGELVAVSPDPRLPIEVTNAAGEVVAAACGRVTTEQAHGAYRIRVRGGDGRAIERAVELIPGEHEVVDLQAPDPEPAVARITEHSALELRPDGTLLASEVVAPVGSASLSTVLGMAGIAALLDETGRGMKLRTLGSRAIRSVLDAGAAAGIHVLMGVADTSGDEAAARLADVRLTCWPFDQPVPDACVTPSPLAADDGLCEYALAAQPGNHWLLIEAAAAKPVALPLAAFESRVTLVVVILTPEGVPGIFEFIPPRAPTAEVDLPFMRQVELVEQLAGTPYLHQAEPLARDLIATRPTPPVAATLGAYLLLRLGHAADLDDVTQRLTVDYEELSDGHVLRAEHLASVGRVADAEACIERALEVGAPIFGEGITRMLDGVAQFRNTHRRARLISAIHDRYLHGSLFSAWHPPKINRGDLLVPSHRRH
jgi:uncharacterized caspase-like protein